MSASSLPQHEAPDKLPPLVRRYLDHVQFEKRLAARTLALYTEDLRKLCASAQQAGVDLEQVQPAHIRRWMAGMHATGRSGRGIALILSGWRGFYTWLAREGRLSANPVQGIRAPRQAKPLPKALSVEEALQLANHQEPDADPWVEARDAALVELLYGSGLRVGELVGLDCGPSDQARGWLDLGAGLAHVLGKGSKRRSVPLGGPSVQAVQRWLDVRTEGAPTGLCWMSGRSLSVRVGGESAPRVCGSVCEPAASARAWPCRCTRTCCVTRLPAMCCSPVATCAPCRNCWDTPASAPPRSTRDWISSTWPRCTRRPILGRARNRRATRR